MRRRCYQRVSWSPKSDAHCKEMRKREASECRGVADVSRKYSGKKAVVVGAGPAGGMAASFLAKEGFNVEVYEQRDDPNDSPCSGNRSNLILLRSRTIDAMREVGVEPPSAPGVYQHGMHMYLGTAILTKHRNMIVESRMEPGRPGFQAERPDIAKAIFNAIQENQSDQITFHFKNACTAVDFEKQTVCFEDEEGKRVTESFHLLVAADGANSFVRQELQKIDESLAVESYESVRGYKALRNLTLLDKDDPVMKCVKPGWLVLVPPMPTSLSSTKSRGAHLSLYQLENGAVHALLVAISHFFEDVQGHEKEWVEAALPSDFPKKWKDEIADRLVDAPYTQISTVNVVSKLCGPRTILLGDAGHSVTPSLSIGANMAITDGKALHKALEAADGDVEAVADIFSKQRVKEIRHFQNLQMILSSFGVQMPRVYRFLAFLGKLHTILFAIGHLCLPHLIPMQLAHRFQYEWVTAEEALNILKRDALIFATLVLTAMYFFVKRMVIPVMKSCLS